MNQGTLFSWFYFLVGINDVSQDNNNKIWLSIVVFSERRKKANETDNQNKSFLKVKLSKHKALLLVSLLLLLRCLITFRKTATARFSSSFPIAIFFTLSERSSISLWKMDFMGRKKHICISGLFWTKVNLSFHSTFLWTWSSVVQNWSNGPACRSLCIAVTWMEVCDLFNTHRS